MTNWQNFVFSSYFFQENRLWHFMQIVCASTHSDQGLNCPLLTESFYTTKYMNGEQRPGRYFTHDQDDLNLRIFCMFEGTFSPDATHVVQMFSVIYSVPRWPFIMPVNYLTFHSLSTLPRHVPSFEHARSTNLHISYLLIMLNRTVLFV